MAVPQRRVDPYTQPRPRNTTTASRRLVSRQIQSNAPYRATVLVVFLAIVSVLLTMGFSLAYVSAGISRLNYEINSIKEANEMILLDNEKIRGQIAELRSLDRIEEIATKELGMIKNEKVEYMILSSTIVSQGKIRQVVEEEELSVPVSVSWKDTLDSWIAWLMK